MLHRRHFEQAELTGRSLVMVKGSYRAGSGSGEVSFSGEEG